MLKYWPDHLYVLLSALNVAEESLTKIKFGWWNHFHKYIRGRYVLS